jgi:hypothetical protein
VLSERPGAVKGAPLLSAAQRTLDGEDRSEMIAEEGKAGRKLGETWAAKMVPSPTASNTLKHNCFVQEVPSHRAAKTLTIPAGVEEFQCCELHLNDWPGSVRSSRRCNWEARPCSGPAGSAFMKIPAKVGDCFCVRTDCAVGGVLQPEILDHSLAYAVINRKFLSSRSISQIAPQNLPGPQRLRVNPLRSLTPVDLGIRFHSIFTQLRGDLDAKWWKLLISMHLYSPP